MSLSGRIKVRRKPTAPAPFLIRVREKNQLICRSCRNRYDSFYFFCPQCLGEVRLVTNARSALILVSLPAGKQKEYQFLFQTFAGRDVPEAEKALRSLPWIVIKNTDRMVVECWKEVLEAEGARLEIRNRLQKMRTRHPPLFEAEAPPPYFWSPDLVSDIRRASSLLENPVVRVKLAEAVLEAHQVTESLYRMHPSDRILFADLQMRTEQIVHDVTRKYFSYYRYRENNFPRAIGKMMDSIRRIRTEIREVQDRVNEQL